MTVYVKTFKGTTISIKCGRRQEANKIKEEVGRKSNIPLEQQCLACEGKALKDGMTIRECDRRHDKRNDFVTEGWTEQ